VGNIELNKLYEQDKSPKVYMFYCATSYDQSEMIQRIEQKGDNIKLVSMPCSGKLDILYLIKAFETGADGVAIMMCNEGECRYLEGNLRAKKRAEAVETLLEEVGLGQGRVAVIQMNQGGIEQAVRDFENFYLKIRSNVRNIAG
jgi:coenzyme F420-reducing hydrogenase delta subunit